MNKAELTNAVADKTGLTKKDSDAVITAVFEVIEGALASGDKVQLVGFGSFEVKHREARVGRNPKTRESINIAATNSPVFKPGKALKESVNK
ncbi:MAG: HU family DNA-binding protein [Oscillospiraceae bacterium]|nr:HU family DNA-binding protein [Oscillospiraceae bacterium]